jgi:hypothetical protein
MAGLESVAFRNSDGSTALVVANGALIMELWRPAGP